EKADRENARAFRASRKKLLRRHLAMRRHILAQALEASDYRAALAAAKDEAELLSLYDDGLTGQLDELQRQITEIRQRGNGSPTATADGAPGGAGGACEAPGHAGPGADARRVR